MEGRTHTGEALGSNGGQRSTRGQQVDAWRFLREGRCVGCHPWDATNNRKAAPLTYTGCSLCRCKMQ